MKEGTSDSMNFYGDQVLFEYKYLLDKQTGKATIDTRLSALADVSNCSNVNIYSFPLMTNRLYEWVAW